MFSTSRRLACPLIPSRLSTFWTKKHRIPSESSHTRTLTAFAQTPNWVWEAKTFDRVSGKHFLPLSSVYSAYQPVELGGGKSESRLGVQQTIRIVHAEFDAAIPTSTFWPVPQPGMGFIDMTSRRSPSIPVSNITIPKTEQATNPIRADLPRSSGTLLAVIGVGFSMTILVAAFLVWKRAR